MSSGTGRLCDCNNDFCMKTAMCNYNPLLNPYNSSSGIDKNPFEMKESYTNLKLRGDFKKKIYKQYIKLILFILLIIIIYYLLKK